MIEALKMVNIPVAKFKVAGSAREAQVLAKFFGFPCVLKVLSDKISHKTEVNGVRIVHDEKELVSAAKDLEKMGDILVQEYVKGIEVFLGLKYDDTFGHVVLAGLGGIFVEILKDISFRVCPVTQKDAKEMIEDLKGKALLRGARGKTVDELAVIDAIVELSHLPKKYPNILELDINPFMVAAKGGKVVDARVVLKNEKK